MHSNGHRGFSFGFSLGRCLPKHRVIGDGRLYMMLAISLAFHWLNTLLPNLLQLTVMLNCRHFADATPIEM